MTQEESKQSLWYKEHLRPHEPMLRGWLNSRYSEQIDVDDLIQEALIRVLRAKEEGELKSPKAYFFAIARNLALDHIRRSKVVFNQRLLNEEAMDLLDEAESIEETVSRNHELEILTEAIQALPERCRRVFTLSKVYGMTYDQIAFEMGITFNTVSAQIAIGLSKCGEYMRKHGQD
ncbi:MAG: sigma-70 family RNA polymerase sigma factor [Verrucomicrobia bacterium]|nr:sigma-70 family RNA polymerase sigma factor [Verrucomicrobiota bacterium]MDA1068996.1 sigma-70 family RNA polymerase sigma factor [Verrucomicrobiota bacterium]